MKKTCVTTILLMLSFICGLQAQNGKQLFDSDWRFYRGGAQRAEQPSFDESQWRSIDLPHDWSTEDIAGTQSPFHPDAISQVNGGFTTGGTAWYRKSFDVPVADRGKQYTLYFEGVAVVCEIWLNGDYIGKHTYGYTSFQFNLTSKLKFGQKNVLAVKVMNEGENSRWYYGSGIYRHVWLDITSPVYIPVWGTYITTPEITSTLASVNIQTSVENTSGEDASIKLITLLKDDKGNLVAKVENTQTVTKGTTSVVTQSGEIKNPVFWSLENPHLYKAETGIYVGDKLVDTHETSFGVRTIKFDAVSGFQLNGKTIKLKGGCIHHDNGPLGSRAYDRAEERRVEIHKASGYNAIRSAHNPPSPALLEACDRLGMLVIDEAFDMWKEAKNPYDYHLYFNDWWQKDVESMVLRDRNHPSVILWSIGNEIPGRHTPEVAGVARKLADHIRKLDPSRLITSAVNDVKDDKDNYFANLDVAGYNYAPDRYAVDHSRKPNRVIVATESFPLEAFEYWMAVEDNPYVIGDFVWTSWDYIGEASIGWRGYMQEKNFYPWNLAFCGDIDICGWKRPQSYYRDALWMPNQISLFVKPPQPSFPENPNRESWSKWHWYDVVADWNWAGNENKSLEVSVYSSCEQVELFLNGKSLGRKPTNRSSKFIATWQVPYQPGNLKAVGYNGQKQVNVSELKTAGQPLQITAKADRPQIKANDQDLSYITFEITDDKGLKNPKTENLLKFEISGPGKIVAVGNANPVSTESYQLPQRNTWQGRCMVIVKSDNEAGTITLKASGDGLNPVEVNIQSVSL